MSKATTRTQDDVDRAERRRAKLIVDFRNIGVHIDQDTPLEDIPPVDQITKLRMLATKHRRPIAHPDLTDRALVIRELDRLMMLDGGTRRKGSYHTIKIDPCPVSLTGAQKRARALEAKQVRDGAYATGRFAETVGYGSHVSYSIQVADARNMSAEPLILPATDAQLDYIRSVSAQKRIPVQLPTRFDVAQELLDELIAAPARPTPRQTKYLADLQAQLGIDPKPARTYDEARTELDRLVAIRNSQRS